ncbi:MAG TPA: TetR family transcriptional regulator [Longimicrobiales bacterium]|nr:TetR family transcriptional regulator [Longimicrobiales bacterium]
MKHKNPHPVPSRPVPSRNAPSRTTSAPHPRARSPQAPSPPASAARGEDTRAALLVAGRAAFARRGFDGSSVRDITRDAGVNLGAVTYHFESKRGLYAAVLVEGLTPLVDRVGQAAGSPGSPLERLDAVVDVFFAYVAVNPDLPRLMMQEVAAGKIPPPELVALIRRNAGYVAGILTDGVKDGSMRAVHPMLGAISIVSQPVFLNIMSPLLREVGGVDISDPAVRAIVVRHVKALLREGFSCSREASA